MNQITVPSFSPNESVVAIVDMKKGDECKKGDVLCVFESTKTTFDYHAEEDGFFVFTKKVGDRVSAGEIVGYLDTKRINLSSLKSPDEDQKKV